MGEKESIQDAVVRIADCLERIEKALPGCSQEALSGIVEAEIKRVFTTFDQAARTPLEYK